MKRVKSIVVIILALAILGVLFNYFIQHCSDKEENLRLASIAVAMAVSDIKSDYSGNSIQVLISEYTEVLSPGAVEKLSAYDRGLKAKTGEYIDLDDVYTRDYSDLWVIDDSIEAPPVVDTIKGESEIIEDDGFDIVPDSELYDSRIELIDGKRKIHTSKLKFNREGLAYVGYNGSFMEFRQDEVEESYDMMLKNPKYVYNYTASEILGDTIEVLLTSLYDNSNVVIKVYNNGVQIIDFEEKAVVGV